VFAHPDMDVCLRPWAPDDLQLLERLLGDPEMTRYIGGPEAPEKLVARHHRYLDFTTPGGTFAVVIGQHAARVGWVGYWPSEWDGEHGWEIGWSVLPEFQGRGIATAATMLALERARTEGLYRHADAYPSVENAASNKVCQNLGFELLGEVDVEYPPGHTMHSNHWRLDLGQESCEVESAR
jgi:RimJ/RimL family protein N-acetyltransferase